MVIGVIQASSQKSKNALLYNSTVSSVKNKGHNVVNFGVFEDENENYSYVETAVCISFLLCSGSVDFVVTGCSSGQGMMLALNSLPGVLCGYTPTPQDAFLFGRINGGNAASLPLGLGFGWCGEINLQCTLEKLFDGCFGCGYPAQDAERKANDTRLMKSINALTKRDWKDIIDGMDTGVIVKAMSRKPVIEYVKAHKKNEFLPII